MDAASAIAALQKQKQRGLELASDNVTDSVTRQGWYNTTQAILTAAFGPGSRNIGAVLPKSGAFCAPNHTEKLI